MEHHHQYQVHEDIKEKFQSELPVREDEEYYFDKEKVPENYFLPPNQKPLTLQSVLRPSANNKPVGHMRPPFRRPAPPEIKLRRPPPPMYQKHNNGYPLSMPNHHNKQELQKKPPVKFNQNRPPPNMNRPPHNMDRLAPPAQRPPPTPPQMAPISVHHMSKPPYKSTIKLMPKPNNSFIQMQTNVMDKPTNQQINSINQPNYSLIPQTLNLGQTDIIANHVVKSQITLPGGSDSIAQHSITQSYLNRPGQIILGKPMDNPMPLDQQMIPTKQYILQTPSTPTAVHYQSTPSNIDNEKQSQNEIKSSDFIGESTDGKLIQPAVNTGFKPDSIVVESGFKPIIREPLMAGVDRIADEYEKTGGNNRREDTDVVEDYDGTPQLLVNNHAYPSETLTETFEPMFIPSPKDYLLTKEVFPTNHAKEDRPHPIYMKTDTTLFSQKPSEKNKPADLVMESDRVSPHYLPPDPKLPKEHSQKLSNSETFTTYDGKTVSAETLTSVVDNKTTKLFSSKLPANTEQLLRTPQFGPFKGNFPPPVEKHISEDPNLPEKDSKTTLLSPVDTKNDNDTEISDLKPESSANVPSISTTEDYDNFDEYETEEDEDQKTRVRRATKATSFEQGEIQAVPTNGHSKPVNQVEFEIGTSSASSIRLLWLTHILLMLCVKLL